MDEPWLLACGEELLPYIRSSLIFVRCHDEIHDWRYLVKNNVIYVTITWKGETFLQRQGRNINIILAANATIHDYKKLVDS